MSRACTATSLVGAAALAALVVWPTPEVRLTSGTYIHFKVAADADVFGAPLFAGDASAYALAVQRGAPDLSRWRRVAIPTHGAEQFAIELARSPLVESAFSAPLVELASALTGHLAADDACPIRTPSYEPYQGYLGPAPAGIDAPAAWVRPGGTGANVWFADIEGGWNAAHEDLPGERITHVSGTPYRSWIPHGTAVLGEIAARDNDIGMVGIAPAVERIFTASIGGRAPAAAIDDAQARLRPGDVLLIELHAIGPRGRFLPVEFWDDIFEAIVVATSRGVIVVEAGGNGGEDLDHRAYAGKLGRADRDSGAILVGAGGPPRVGFTDRARLDFSNYGSRLDVQGWGRRVATLDYGDLQACGSEAERDYTDLFSGTSSASPIVAGAALLLSSVAKASGGDPLTPQRTREILATTGSPQVDGPAGPASQRIGARPDLAAALEALTSLEDR